MRAPALIAIFLISTTLYASSGWFPFFSRGESREALVVRALIDGGSLILPRREPTEIPVKPPMFHWLSALALRAGVRPEELAIRLPSVLFGAGGVTLTAALAATYYGPAAGVAAAAVVGSSFEWARMSTQARVDMTLTFFLVGAVIAWHLGLRAATTIWGVRLGYLLCAAAVLTKGPVGLVLPLMITVAGVALTGNRRHLRLLLDAPGILLALCLCIGWYGLAWSEGGSDFLQVHVFNENLNRFMGRGQVPHSHGYFYYIPTLAGAFAPWTLVLPWTIWSAWNRREASDRFLLTWIVTVLLFYTLAAGKRSVYLLPLFPPLAILTGSWLARSLPHTPTRLARVTLRIGAGAFALGAMGIAFGWVESLLGVLRPWMHGNDLQYLPIALEVLDANGTGLSITLVTVAGGLLALAGRRFTSTLPRQITILCLLAIVWTLGPALFAALPIARALTPRAFADRVRSVVGEEDNLWACGHTDYAFRYYVRRYLPQWKPHPPSDKREFVVTPAMDDETARSYGFTTRLIQDAPQGSAQILELEEIPDRMAGPRELDSNNADASPSRQPLRCPRP
jgi:4-amino-4-deoxy-L-arabinose transferase-like glycosyltransferase